MSKAKTIKGIQEVDLQYFDSLKKTDSGDLTDTGAFARLISEHRQFARFQEEIQKLRDELGQVNALNDELNEANRSLTLQVEEFNNRQPETIQIEKEIKVEVERPLTWGQFICTPDEELLVLARKARPFIRKDGQFKFDNENYPDKLAVHSMRVFLKDEYSHLIK
jgi:hypothetical protein